jgi:16S rRNA (cytidine1402-2'-O)-methyltransferase
MARQRSQPIYPSRQESADRRAGTLYIVGTPIGSFDDLSIRALMTLKNVSVIAAESPLVTQALLDHHGISATITSYGPQNREEKISVLLHSLHQGQHVALVSDNGMPVIYDPGRLLIASAQQAGYPVTVIPGPSALTAAVAISGYSGDRIHFEGKFPRTRHQADTLLAQFKGNSETLVFFVPSAQCSHILRSLDRVLPTRQVTLAIDMTRTSERLYQGTAGSLLAQLPSLPENADVTVVVGGEPQKGVAKKRLRAKRRATRRLDAE